MRPKNHPIDVVRQILKTAALHRPHRLMLNSGLARPISTPRANNKIAMVWSQYIYLVYSGRVLALRKAQNILAVDFLPKLLDRVLDVSFV